MSQIEHRQRIRDRQQAAANRNLQVFSPAAVAAPVHVSRPTSVAPAPAVVEPVALSTVSADDAQTPRIVQPQPTVLQAIVPSDMSQTQGMTPSALRDHGKRTAEMLASLPQEQYDATLKSLELSNSNLYGIVVDELNNMAATQAAGEGDGFDLSGLTSGAVSSPTPQPDVVRGPSNPNLPQDVQ